VGRSAGRDCRRCGGQGGDADQGERGEHGLALFRGSMEGCLPHLRQGRFQEHVRHFIHQAPPGASPGTGLAKSLASVFVAFYTCSQGMVERQGRVLSPFVVPVYTTTSTHVPFARCTLSQRYAQDDILVESTAKKEVKIYKLKDAKVGGGVGGGGGGGGKELECGRLCACLPLFLSLDLLDSLPVRQECRARMPPYLLFVALPSAAMSHIRSVPPPRARHKGVTGGC
jgi:hypothetical protein